MRISIDDIRPFNDAEAVRALRRASYNPLALLISRFVFPDRSCLELSRTLRQVGSIDDYQRRVMSPLVENAVARTSSGFSFDGFEKISSAGKFLAISNHRDMILDVALTQWILLQKGLPLMEVCIGNNLIRDNALMSDLLRSNRMVSVLRGLPAREMYEASACLSEYIRESVTSQRCSVWVAQKEGRAKNGEDRTAQGLLKMLNMSGKGSFAENFEALNIVPLSISYEYEPCDLFKARELYVSESRKYKKRHGEDTRSIIEGVRQWKGGIHLSADKPITREELAALDGQSGNDRFRLMRRILDERIIRGYKLWKTNYIAYDLLHGVEKYRDEYDAEDRGRFVEYVDAKIAKAGRAVSDLAEFRRVFLGIYAAPVSDKKRLLSSNDLSDSE